MIDLPPVIPTQTQQVIKPQRSEWMVVNDGVMGGLSRGSITKQSQSLRFSGFVSTENNGGFSSIYTSMQPIVDDFDRVSVTVTGDSSAYQLRFWRYLNGYRIGYKADFTTNGTAEQVFSFDLSDFQATYRGMIIQGVPELTSENVSGIGFLINSKEDKTFSLTIHHISFNYSL